LVELMTGIEKGAAKISLAAAAAIVYKEATGRVATDDGALEQVAASIAKHAQLFAREGWGTAVEPVRPGTLEEATFLYGGDIMRSRNVTYADVCVRESDLPAVIEKLREIDTPKG
jgi:hypothetical protein